MSQAASAYPVGLDIDYPDRPVNRLTSFFRLFTVIPIGIIASFWAQSLPAAQFNVSYNTNEQEMDYFFSRMFTSTIDVGDMLVVAVLAVFLVPLLMFLAGFITNFFNPVVLMLVFRRKYPRWWFDYYVNLIGFIFRVASYFTLLTDVYPSTDEEQNVHVSVTYPDAEKDLSQGLPLIKWFLAIPHYIVLAVVMTVACFCDIFIWFAILFTGRVPRGLFDFVAGSFRWGFRVSAYALFQFTDKYPPFSLS